MRTSEKTKSLHRTRSLIRLFAPFFEKLSNCQNDLPKWPASRLPPMFRSLLISNFGLLIIFNSSKIQEEFKSSQHRSSKYFHRLVHHHYEDFYLLQHKCDCTTCNHVCWISCCVSCKWTKSKAKDVHAHFSDQILEQILSHPVAFNIKHSRLITILSCRPISNRTPRLLRLSASLRLWATCHLQVLSPLLISGLPATMWF